MTDTNKRSSQIGALKRPVTFFVEPSNVVAPFLDVVEVRPVRDAELEGLALTVFDRLALTPCRPDRLSHDSSRWREVW
jgi:hypothetical protein